LLTADSIILVSQSNQVLLLCRVKTSTSFASAHVFPGGNVDPKQDGELPAENDVARHQDSLVYRIAAIRECFEESGILLAKAPDGSVVQLDEATRESARKQIHNNEKRFVDWLAEMGVAPDTDGLVPFTRWITPRGVGRRFTTQMYLYMLPVSDSLATDKEMVVPTPDGGVEHTAAAFEDASTWLRRQGAGEIVLFPPQYFLLAVVAGFLTPAAGGRSTADMLRRRRALLDFATATPAARTEGGRRRPTARIPWTDKVMSPHVLFVSKSDGRVALGIDRPGPELEHTGRGGDWERVVLVSFTDQGPRNLEVRDREEAVRREREPNGDGEPDGAGFVMKI
jgi:8-oxo-dGTP pyrophosphatase MutT (NUDIX family)